MRRHRHAQAASMPGLPLAEAITRTWQEGAGLLGLHQLARRQWPWLCRCCAEPLTGKLPVELMCKRRVKRYELAQDLHTCRKRGHARPCQQVAGIICTLMHGCAVCAMPREGLWVATEPVWRGQACLLPVQRGSMQTTHPTPTHTCSAANCSVGEPERKKPLKQDRASPGLTCEAIIEKESLAHGADMHQSVLPGRACVTKSRVWHAEVLVARLHGTALTCLARTRSVMVDMHWGSAVDPSPLLYTQNMQLLSSAAQ